MAEKIFDGVFESVENIQDEFDKLSPGTYITAKVIGDEKIEFHFVDEYGEELPCSADNGGKLFELLVPSLKIRRVKNLNPAIVKFDLDDQGRIVFV
jgi:hypothetical protein